MLTKRIIPCLDVVAGRVVIWTELAPSAFTRLLQMRPVLRGLLEVVDLEPQSEEETMSLLQALAKRQVQTRTLQIEDGCAQAAVSLARQYLNSGSFP